MNLTKILKDLLRERDELDRAIEALERLMIRSRRRRGPGRPPKPLSLRRRYVRRRGPGRPPGRGKARRGPGRPPKVEAPSA